MKNFGHFKDEVALSYEEQVRASYERASKLMAQTLEDQDSPVPLKIEDPIGFHYENHLNTLQPAMEDLFREQYNDKVYKDEDWGFFYDGNGTHIVTNGSKALPAIAKLDSFAEKGKDKTLHLYGINRASKEFGDIVAQATQHNININFLGV